MKTSKTSTHEKVLKLQKKIFRALRIEADLLLGTTPSSIKKYQRENDRDFKPRQKAYAALQKGELIKEIAQADVTFIADFHTFDQAQRGALRIIKEVFASSPGPWVIGLELIPSQFQDSLDKFQAGEISLTKFHEIIAYNDEWGFPWKNYALVFDWAKENQVKLIALNRPKAVFSPKEDKELHSRDQWAAGIITDLFIPFLKNDWENRPKVLVLYGELHIGTLHLPTALKKISKSTLKKELSWTSVHQNDDALFWRLAKKKIEQETDVLRLKKNVFCVFSGTPWAKLQSLISWAENGISDPTENEQDHLSLIRSYGETLAQFLGVSPPSYESLTIYTIEQVDFLDHLNRFKNITTAERKIVRFLTTSNQRFFISKTSTLYLGFFSHNGASELAGIHLLRSHSPYEIFFIKERDDFYRMILESTFGFFSSLILNPKRKCDLSIDHKRRIKALKEGEPQAFPCEKEARKLAIEFIRKPLSSKLKIENFQSHPKRRPTLIMVARYLGKFLGKKLYQDVLSEKISIERTRNIFLLPPQKSSDFFETNYRELVRLLYNPI